MKIVIIIVKHIPRHVSLNRRWWNRQHLKYFTQIDESVSPFRLVSRHSDIWDSAWKKERDSDSPNRRIRCFSRTWNVASPISCPISHFQSRATLFTSLFSFVSNNISNIFLNSLHFPRSLGCSDRRERVRLEEGLFHLPHSGAMGEWAYLAVVLYISYGLHTHFFSAVLTTVEYWCGFYAIFLRGNFH